MKDLYCKNYETLMKEIKHKWKDIPCLWIGRMSIIKISVLPNAIPVKIPIVFFLSRTNNPKICMDPQKTPNSQSNLEKEPSWRYHNSRLQDILQSYNKVIWYCHKSRHRDQQNRIESPEIN